LIEFIFQVPSIQNGCTIRTASKPGLFGLIWQTDSELFKQPDFHLFIVGRVADLNFVPTDLPKYFIIFQRHPQHIK